MLERSNLPKAHRPLTSRDRFTVSSKSVIGPEPVTPLQFHLSLLDLHVKRLDFGVISDAPSTAATARSVANAGVATHLFESGDERFANSEMSVFFV